MKTFNRITAYALTIITLISLVGNIDLFAYKVTEGADAAGGLMGEYSYGDLTYDIVENEAVIMYSIVSGDLVIPDEIDGYKVTEIADYAFYECEGIVSVIIGNNVRRIGDHAFDYCLNMESVTIGNSVKEIGEYAFRYCSFVDSISLPENIVRLGYGFLHGTDYYISAKWTNDILYIDDYLIEAKVDKISGSYKIKDGVTCIADGAFRYCSGLTEVIIPDSVIAIGGFAFSGCPALRSVRIGQSVKYIHDYAFEACNEIKSVEIGPSVLEIGYRAFADVKCMEVIDGVYYIGNYLITADTDISGKVTVREGTIVIAERAFADCKLITAVELPSTLKSISSVAFSGTDSLDMINIPASVTRIGGDAFIYGKKNLRVYIEDISVWCAISFENRDANPFRRKNATMVDAYYGKTVTEVTVPDGVESIGDYAFYNWTTLKKLTVPDSVKYIGYGCFEQKKEVDGKDIYVTNESVTFICGTSSYAYKYALDKGITLPKCEHSFTEYVKVTELSCTVDETEVAVCDNGCGTRDTRVVNKAIGHRFENYISNNDATCTSDGTKTASCVYGCGKTDSIIESGTMLEHSYTVYTPDGNATCTSDGTKTASCDHGCGNTDTVADEGSVTDHKFTSYIFNDDSDCINDGTKTAFCDYGCGESNTVTAEKTAKGHSFGDWQITVEPTYEAEGTKIRVCSVCGTEDEQVIPILALSFTDVKDNHWFAESVKYCVQMGYVRGMTEFTFVPNGKLTRAQFLTLLAKLDGVDLTVYEGKDAGFTDVKPSHWYNIYVCWAVEQELTAGLTPTTFGPNANVTRAQLARFFYVYSEKKGISVEGRADITAFPDAKAVAGWAVDAITWAVDAGIIGGVKRDNVNYLDPNGTATRAQATVMFKAFDTFRNE